MIALFILPFYLLINLLVYLWARNWTASFISKKYLKVVHIVLLIIHLFLIITIPVGFFLPVSSSWKRFFTAFGNYWLGVSLYLYMAFFAALLIRFLLRITGRISKEITHRKTLIITGLLCCTIAIGTGLYGTINARKIYTTNYNVTINKESKLDELNIVMVADLHLGYSIGTEMMEQMVEKINAQHPDLVIIAGDIVDNSYDAIDDPERITELLASIESKYGTYAIYGNHDTEEPILCGFTWGGGENKYVDTRTDEMLKNAGITILNDESVLVADSFYLIGRRDLSRPSTTTNSRLSAEEVMENVDLDYPCIVLDHEPNDLEAESDSGADLILSGHTHAGQIFPLTVICDCVWENNYGELKLNNDTTSIVTSGVGLFGPNMRVGTHAEITDIQVTFNKN